MPMPIRPSLRILTHRCHQFSAHYSVRPELLTAPGILPISPRSFSSSSSTPSPRPNLPPLLQQAHPPSSSHPHQPRTFTTTPTTTMPPRKNDWSATQYLKFQTERTRAVTDLLTHTIPHIPSPNPRIFDLGCGPGNSTQALLTAFPAAEISALDSSPDMLAKASSMLPKVDFVEGDLATFEPGEDAHLLFSNAVFHWLRQDTRIPTLVRLFRGLKSGGVVAIQVPDNYNEASHRLMRDTALMAAQPWSKYFSDTRIGDLGDKRRPDLDFIEAPETFYNALIPYAEGVDIWRTEYRHVLKDAGAIVEWVTGTGLQPFLQRMGEDEEARRAFLRMYEEGLREAYGALKDGRVLLGYPRLFVVAVRK
ncbi:S-adenosyl-L-methionine-dependent methyltransferase [Byssothecium circinans]|uniref:S-adenosyl-L-methionine-dependent methyltransferase n=1 Tax=Byssothecium circinans TaxID=147558 RepID=A0A6A5U309_9PLEO|nr:S-adenosyl-L-methionine-dependent methyltransferase [Byssothecium circinans]